MSRPRVYIGSTSINFYSTNGPMSSLSSTNDGNININTSILNVKTVTGATGYFNEIGAKKIVGSTGIFDNILTTKIGAGAGAISQGSNTVAFGNNAGNDRQGISSVAIGSNAGSKTQGSSSIAIGNAAGYDLQGQQSVAVGNNAGYSEQKDKAVAIGFSAGYTTQGVNSVAIGSSAGSNFQKPNSVAIGNNAGYTYQEANSVAIGSSAGSNSQNFNSVAIGSYAGNTSQEANSVAIGNNAGRSLQGAASIAIGLNAGLLTQGNNSIAIGNEAGPTGMSANSIILNASGTALYGTGPTGGFYVAPIFMDTKTGITGANTILVYGPDKQIIGATGDALADLGLGSTKEKSNDVFIRNNFIDPPDYIESKNISITKSSSDIYITFEYPKQMNYGFGLLPVVSNLNFLINPGAGQTGFTGMASPQFIKTASTSSVVQCIDISKTKSMGETGMNNNKIYYTIPYKESGDFDVTIWYGNGNILSNKTHVPVTGGYMTSGTPSAPGEILDQPNIPTDNSITFRFRGSTQIDVNDSASSANLQFKVFYTPTENLYRFGGAVGLGVTGMYLGTLTNTSVTPNTSISYTNGYFNAGNSTGLNYSGHITSIHPDTKYNIQVDASNTLSTGFVSYNFDVITNYAPAPSFVSSGSNLVTLPGLFSGRTISGGTLVTNILRHSIGSSFTQTFPIHNAISSRGATGATPLVTFTSSVTGPAGTIMGPSASYTGFGASYVYGTSSANNINMTLSPPTDVTGLAGYNGYYLRGNVTTAMPTTLTNGLAASAMPYTLSVTGTYSSSNSAVSTNYYAPFYYDGQLPSQPSINGTPTLSITSAVTGMECGITVVTSSLVASLTVPGVTGIGNIFYNSNNILTYSTTVGTLSPSVESGLLNAIRSPADGSYTFTNNLTISSLPSFRQSNLGAPRVTPVNLYGTAGVSKTPSMTEFYFIDSNSVSNSLLTFPTFPTTTGPTAEQLTSPFYTLAKSFVRVYSTTSPTGCTKSPSSSTINDITINNNGTATSYSAFLYDNTQSLTSASYGNELLYVGINSSSSIFTGGHSNYRDYNIYRYNTNANYSGITSGIRYVTFAWRVNPFVFTNDTPTFNILTFTLQGISGMTISNGTVYPGDGQSPLPPPLFIYYRVEDSSSLNLPTNIGSPCITTFWINANDTIGSSGSLITSTNCYNVNDSNASVPYYIGVTPPKATIPVNTTNITLPAKTGGYGFSRSNRPANGNDNTPVYIYLRIGLPIQSSAINFTNVTCALSASS
jgi:hypothetical protein